MFLLQLVGSRRVYAIQEHKTATYQPANFSLSLDDNLLLVAYNRRVQDTLSVKAPDVGMREYFFIRYPGDGKITKINASQEVINKLEVRLLLCNKIKVLNDDL